MTHQQQHGGELVFGYTYTLFVTATKNEFKKYELEYEYGLVLPLSLSDFKLSVGGPSFKRFSFSSGSMARVCQMKF